MADKKGEETKRERDSNVISVSLNRGFTFFVYLAKKIFADYDEVELHSLGAATATAVQTSENLIRHGYATLESIRTDTIELERRDGGKGSKAKLFITLKKAADFDEVVKAY
jgi:hypothetical protein